MSIMIEPFSCKCSPSESMMALVTKGWAVTKYVYMTLEKIDLLCESSKNQTFKMHVNMSVRLKLYLIEFLKVELTHPDNGIGSQITPACIHFNWTWTDLSSMCMIDSHRGVFDPELEKHKAVEESQ